MINHAKENGILIFTVVLGRRHIFIRQMAEETGGLFFGAATSDNLKTLYQQLADVLFEDQYILIWNSNWGVAATADLTVKATSGTKKIRSTVGL